jgi:predicted MPP superfamily phosphohydrolase
LKLKIFLIIALVTVFAHQVHTGLITKINEVKILIPGDGIDSRVLRVALLSDLHIGDDESSFQELEELWLDVLAEQPDIIMLAGDYINNGRKKRDIAHQRARIAKILGRSGDIPVIAVLGNHDEWSIPALWSLNFRAAGIVVLENQVMEIDRLNLCVRGFGDAFTRNFKYLDFPKSCVGKLQVSITHDPAGAFHPQVKGLVLAGHTHCGQIALPLLGPIYVPSDAPKESQCGLYEDSQRQLFVSSGIGTSILPIRFFAQSQWDLLTIN